MCDYATGIQQNKGILVNFPREFLALYAHVTFFEGLLKRHNPHDHPS